MFNSIFSNKKKLNYVISKESPRQERLWRLKYAKLMRSRQICVWVR